MRTSRIYLDKPLSRNTVVDFDRETAHYLSRVLRMKVGTHFSVFNESDGEFSAEIVQQDRNSLQAQINDPVTNNANPRLQLNLGLGISRGERMDYAVQKSTELGIGSITPLTTERSEVKLTDKRLDNKLSHWQKIAINASEQCGRTSVPEVSNVSEFLSWCESNPGGVMFDHSGTTDIGKLAVNGAINILIGPEGGFTEQELQIAKSNGYEVVKVGPRVLRTETAPVVAISLLQYLYGDFRNN